MNLTRINVVLSVLLAIAATLTIAMEVDHTQLNVEFLPDMKRSPAFDAFAANPVLPGGRTQQAPVPGSIARGDLPLYYSATKEDAIRAGEELQNPFAVAEAINPPPAADEAARPADSEHTTAATPPQDSPTEASATPQARLDASIQRGALVYGVFCVSCHGASGAGDGPVTKRGFPPPPPLPTGKSVLMKDGQLFHILTYGQGSMSSMAAQLKRNSRWDVIDYVRSLQQGAAQAAAQNPVAVPDTAGEPAETGEPDGSTISSEPINGSKP
ncbi:MAG TPA: cytochrome c [Planctomycetes bacterium]|nr:cytochrome c [Fuerstiella sp.]HIK90922.1 cytochrome c [Planctomycetota bacterium]